MKNLFNAKLCKLYSITTVICFVVSIFGNNICASVTLPNSYDNIFDKINIISHTYGKTTSVCDLSSDITVINIQDLHCHPQTQKNIDKIITEINNNYNLKSVFIEGGYGDINTSWLNQIKSADFKNKIIEQLLNNGTLTGAEYYATKNKKEHLLKGLDDKAIHSENILRLSEIMDKQTIYDSVIQKVNKELLILHNKYLNEQNKRFSRILEKYKNGEINNTKFYRLLLKYADKINGNLQEYNNIVPINTEFYTNINKYLNISQQSKQINTKLVGIQLQQLIFALKNKIPYGVYTKLLSVTDNFNNTDVLYDFLINFCKNSNFDLSNNFNELNKFLNVVIITKDFNPVDIINEENHLIKQIRTALSYDNTEYEITYISDFKEYFVNYLKYSLTSGDWTYCKDEFDNFRKLYAKYAVIDELKSIETDLNMINKYYDVNYDRNNIFINNILNNIDTEIKVSSKHEKRAPEEILKQSKEVIIVISGGFHSSDLQSMLASKNINTIVITPNITTDISTANKKYISSVKEQNKILSQALALKLVSSSSDIEQKTLLARTAIEIFGKNNIEQLNAMLGENISVSYLGNGIFDIRFNDTVIKIDSNAKLNDTDFDKQSTIANIIKNAIKNLPSTIPAKGLQSVFIPEFYKIIKNISLQLFNLDIYFADGPIYEITNSKFHGKDIDGISPEIYSTFADEIQMMLFKKNASEETIMQASKKHKTFIDIIRNILPSNDYNTDNDYVAAKDIKQLSSVPAIDNIFQRVLYKIYFNTIVKAFVFLLKLFAKDKKLNQYFEILKNANNENYLIKIISSSNIKIKYKLFAFMYLKKRNIVIPENITYLLKRQFVSDIRQNGFTVKNNFDLRALSTGIFLSLDDIYSDLISQKDKISIYKKISKAVIVNRGKKKKTSANSAMYFVSYDPLTIAHELGHNILYKLNFYSSNKEGLTVHELFANVTANIFGETIGLKKVNTNTVLYDLANENFDYKYIFKEEHNAARSFINLISKTSTAIHHNTDWNLLADIIINYISRHKKIEKEQGEILNFFINQYFKQIINSETYPEFTMDQIREILSSNNLYTITYPMLQEIKNISNSKYLEIIEKIKRQIAPQKSYKYKYSKKQKLGDIDDFIVINNIIFSQPEKITQIVQIIKSELLNGDSLSKSEMEMLVSIELLLKLGRDIHSVSIDDFIMLLSKYIRLMPNKKIYSISDFQAMEYTIKQYPYLTMTWLDNLLFFFGKYGFNERQKIITAVEYPIIIFGMIFPKIKEWFIKRHKYSDFESVEKRLNELEQSTEHEILKLTGISLKEIKSFFFIKKMLIASKLISNKILKNINIAKHLELNKANIDKTDNISVKFIPYEYESNAEQTVDNNIVFVFVTKTVNGFESYKLINTGLTVNGNIIWKIDSDKILLYYADGVDCLEISKTLKSSRLLQKNLKKFLNLQNNININIKASVIVDNLASGTYFEDGNIITKSTDFTKSLIEIFNSIAVMYSQKTIISLENIQNDKLEQALFSGNARKVISLQQFEYLQQTFEQNAQNLTDKIIMLKEKGIEIYIKSDNLNSSYMKYGLNGQIIENKLYDYYTNEETELDVLQQNITIKDLENKLINSDKPLLINIDALNNIFRNSKNIITAFNGFESLLGNIKIKFGLQNITKQDIANFAYSINIEAIPVVGNNKHLMLSSDITTFINIIQLPQDNPISIILNDTKINDKLKIIFLNAVKERILAKTKLEEYGKEYGLKDKKLEILLGKLLLLQNDNTDKESLLDNEINKFKESQQSILEGINKLSQKALVSKAPEAINTIIELILVYAEEYKSKDIIKVKNIDVLAYRQMLAAA